MTKMVIKVSSKSNPNSVAGAIASMIKENDVVEVETIGAGALNQAIKGCIIARGFLVAGGIDLIFTPSFMQIELDGLERSGIKLIVERKY